MRIRGARPGSFNIPILTAPNINKGPEVLVKEINLFPSFLLIKASSLSLEVNLTPTGYPEIKDIVIGNAASPGRLNSGFIKGSSNLPMKSTNPFWINISDIIKKGSKEGITMVKHMERPDFALSKDRAGFNIIPTKEIKIIINNNILGKDIL